MRYLVQIRKVFMSQKYLQMNQALESEQKQCGEMVNG